MLYSLARIVRRGDRIRTAGAARSALGRIAIAGVIVSIGAFASMASEVEAQVRRPTPVVERIEPTAGPPGSTFALLGRHFVAEQTVWLGSTQLEVVSRLPNRWTLRVPEGATSGNVEVRAPRGVGRGPRFRVTERPDPPVIEAMEPASAPPGAEVRLRGSNFSARLGENTVHLGESPVVVHRASPTELVVIVPNDATSAPFRVRIAGRGEASTSETFEVVTGTRITSFEPTFGPPGTRVVVRGTSLGRNAREVSAFLGDTRARVVSHDGDSLTIEIPRRRAATGRLSVAIRRGGRARSSEDFEIRYPPEIRAVEPRAAAPGHRLTLSGAHFGTDVRRVEVKLGDHPLRVRGLADDSIEVEITEGAETGTLSVRVEGFDAVEARGEVGVLVPVSIERFSPSSGPVGAEVTIAGQGFASRPGDNQVTLAGEACEVLAASETELRFRVPEGARSGPLEVRVPHAGQAAGRQPFVITRPPVVTAMEPESAAPGAEVTLRGSNFGTRPGLVEVRVGSSRARVLRVSESELTFVVPPEAETAPVRVTVRLQGSGLSARPLQVER